METTLTWLMTGLETLGPWAWIVAPLVMAVVAVLPLPAEAPAMINGMIFGPLAGSVVTWVGAMLGAVASFELSRRFGRPLAERVLGPGPLARTGETVEAVGWQAMLLARFVPLVAFTALNWGAGLAGVPRWRFLWTTAVGIVPGVVVFTASGTGVALALERLSPASAVVAVVGVVALLAWSWRRRARRPGPEPAPEPVSEPAPGPTPRPAPEPASGADQPPPRA